MIQIYDSNFVGEIPVNYQVINVWRMLSEKIGQRKYYIIRWLLFLLACAKCASSSNHFCVYS